MEIITMIPLNVLINVPNNNNNNMLSLIFSHNNKNNTNLQFDIILSNEASALEASFRFLACHALIFQKNQQFQKNLP
jgi:hypothetical protein